MTVTKISKIREINQSKNELESEKISSKKTAINYKRMSIALPEKIADLLLVMSEEQGITQNEALKRAILREAFLQKELKNDSDILIRRQGQETLERLIFM